MKTARFTVASALFCLLILHQNHSQAALVAHWTGDNTTADASGNGHDGTLFNGTGYGSGVIGNAFQFDGINDYVAIPGSSALQPNEISVALWVNAAASNVLRLVADSSHGGGGAANQNGWALQLRENNRISFAYGNGSIFPELVSNAVVADNTFHHVVATLSGSTMQIFVDGTLDATGAYAGSPTDSIINGGEIRLGDHHQFSRPLNGLLDDVRVYDHVLQTAEVQTLSISAVPEPTSMALLAAVLGMATLKRRRR